jgi:hypothetical protein
MSDLHVDFTGRSIMPGDFIACASLGGRSAILELALVVSCPYSKPKYGRPEYPTLRVVKMHWRGDKAGDRLISLQYPKRCVVLGSGSVPAHIEAVLREAYELQRAKL